MCQNKTKATFKNSDVNVPHVRSESASMLSLRYSGMNMHDNTDDVEMVFTKTT